MELLGAFSLTDSLVLSFTKGCALSDCSVLGTAIWQTRTLS